LWAVSACLTITLLVSLGRGGLFEKILLGVVGVGLEGSKILAWRKGGKARAFAVILITLSAVASLAASLKIVEESKGSFLAIEVRDSPAYIEKKEEIESLSSEISVLVGRLRVLPSDYSTALGKVEASLSVLRDRKQVLLDSIASEESSGSPSYESSSMVVLLGKTLGLRPELLLLALLIAVASCVEVGALVLSVPTRPEGGAQKSPREAILPEIDRIPESPPSEGVLSPSYGPIQEEKPRITPEDFLKAALEASPEFPYLAGRDRVALSLGLSFGQGKRLVKELLRLGRIRPDGRRYRLVQDVVDGKRLRLSEGTPPRSPSQTCEPVSERGA
jgi:hypothetical protein